MSSPGRGKDVTDDELHDTLRDAHEPQTTQEVATAVGLKRRGTLKRLKEHPQIEGKNGVWWPANGFGMTVTVGEPIDRATDPAPLDDAAAIVADLDFKGDEDTVAERQAAIIECFKLLAADGTATKKDFLNTVYPDHPAGYSTRNSWWTQLQPKLKALADELDGLEAPSRGEQTWHYTRPVDHDE